jgi:non-haem Fe2+, alpha-ketoglutarate-dependent halogenase
MHSGSMSTTSSFWKQQNNPKLIGPFDAIPGGSLRLYGSQVFAKPARVGSVVSPHVVSPHQDMPYWPFEPYELISAWIALDDSTKENGYVRYVIGSHKLDKNYFTSNLQNYGSLFIGEEATVAYGDKTIGN